MSAYGFDYPVVFLLFFNFALPPFISPNTHTHTHTCACVRAHTHTHTRTHLSLFIFNLGPLGQYSKYLCSPKKSILSHLGLTDFETMQLYRGNEFCSLSKLERTACFNSYWRWKHLCHGHIACQNWVCSCV